MRIQILILGFKGLIEIILRFSSGSAVWQVSVLLPLLPCNWVKTRCICRTKSSVLALLLETPGIRNKLNDTLTPSIQNLKSKKVNGGIVAGEWISILGLPPFISVDWLERDSSLQWKTSPKLEDYAKQNIIMAFIMVSWAKQPVFLNGVQGRVGGQMEEQEARLKNRRKKRGETQRFSLPSVVSFHASHAKRARLFRRRFTAWKTQLRGGTY